MSTRPTVSVIATVYNEIATIDDWLDGLSRQSRPPDEIVIVDGGSNDGTAQAIERYGERSVVPIEFFVEPGSSISRGRNLAIECSTCDLIAVTDAGTHADPCWLERLVAPLISGEADVASGFFVPRLTSRWERALAATTLPDAAEVAPDRFLPSSRSVAFRRAWFDAGVRYPEWLDYCEDLVWDLAMRRAGALFVFIPDAIVMFAVRPSPRAFVVQYVRYARGDGKAGLFPRRHALRYATYVGLATAMLRKRPPELLLVFMLGCVYVWRPILRLWRRDRAAGVAMHESVIVLPFVPALRALGDVAKLVGYPAGLAWRWRRFGGLGWRTAWQRVSPAGELFRPAAMTRGNRLPEASRAAESPAESR